MAGGARRKVPVWTKPVAGMECRRCKSRHSAHAGSLDEHGRAHGRAHLRNKVLREGVAKWTFPARTHSRPPMPLPRESSAWRPSQWNIQVEQKYSLRHIKPNHEYQHYHYPLINITPPPPPASLPQSLPEDMEGVVPEELRQRIERILAFPVEGGAAGEGDILPETPPTPTTHMEPTRTPAGGLLQDYLDQLDPEEEEELMFQGSESEENDDDDDLLYDPEKETYTTPYLLFLQHAKSRRRDFLTHSTDLKDDLVQNGETSPSRDDPNEDDEGRDGARGRTGHRKISSVVETTRTTTTADPTTLKDEQELTETGGGGDSLAVPAGAATTPFVPSKKSKKKKKKKGGNEANGGGGDDKDDKDDPGAGDTAEEIVRKNVEKLKKSIALTLFRDFAKTVFAQNEPGFKLFDGFEEIPEGSKDSDEARN
ncbi:uncharacterized protein LOC122253020 [Penaeus japonicus]|uniref:uncharacterized protein LOC122253020 n=1 Tax=Penaeus japonicus TaxID=27405 RepID=UPI001C70D0D6|nr:uncharacterized protein LOC122253020 [Penaeus japonicus]